MLPPLTNHCPVCVNDMADGIKLGLCGTGQERAEYRRSMVEGGMCGLLLGSIVAIAKGSITPCVPVVAVSTICCCAFHGATQACIISVRRAHAHERAQVLSLPPPEDAVMEV